MKKEKGAETNLHLQNKKWAWRSPTQFLSPTTLVQHTSTVWNTSHLSVDSVELSEHRQLKPFHLRNAPIN